MTRDDSSFSRLRMLGDCCDRYHVKTRHRWRTVIDEIANEKYTIGAFVSDVVRFWDDAIGIWMPHPAAGPVAQVAITVAKGTDSGSQTVPIGLPAGIVLDRSALLYVPQPGQSGAKKVPQSDVTVSRTSSGALRVDVAGLNAVPVVVGEYAGIVSGSGSTIAEVHLYVA